MSSAILRSLRVAAESTFGSIDSSTGQPSSSGLTFFGAEFESASLTVFGGESELVEDGTIANGPGGLPPEVSTSWTAAGARVKRQTGDITISMRVKGFGGGNSLLGDANDLPLALALASGMKLTDHGGGEVVPTGMGANNGIVSFAAPPGLADGELVVANVDGCMVANRVVEVDGNDATFSHYWPRALTGSDSIRRGLNFAVGRGADTGAVGDSVVIEARSADASYEAFGGRLVSAAFTNDNGIALVELTLRPAVIITTQGTTSPTTAARVAAPTSVLRGVALYRTDGDTGIIGGASAPISLDASKVPFELDGLTITIENTLVPVGTGCPAIGMSDMEVANTAVTMEYTSKAPSTADELDLLNRVCRGITLAAGPLYDGSTYYNGCAWNIPAASLSADANVTAEDDGLLQQTRSYAMRDYAGDAMGDSGVRNFVFYLGGT